MPLPTDAQLAAIHAQLDALTRPPELEPTGPKYEAVHGGRRLAVSRDRAELRRWFPTATIRVVGRAA